MNRFTAALLCTLLFHSAQAQPVIMLKGLVLDSATGQPLPSATLRVLNSSKGTATNAEGAFQLALEPGRQIVAASFIGYVSDTVSVVLAPETAPHTFLLRPSVIPLPDIVAYAEERDPAEEIILKASQKKHAALSELRTYQFKASTKTTVRSVSRKNAADTIVACVFETQSEGYWKFPDLFKEILTARRQPLSLDRRINTFTVGHLPNFNDDRVSIESYSVVGPTAPDALEYYRIEIVYGYVRRPAGKRSNESGADRPLSHLPAILTLRRYLLDADEQYGACCVFGFIYRTGCTDIGLYS